MRKFLNQLLVIKLSKIWKCNWLVRPIPKQNIHENLQIFQNNFAAQLMQGRPKCGSRMPTFESPKPMFFIKYNIVFQIVYNFAPWVVFNRKLRWISMEHSISVILNRGATKRCQGFRQIWNYGIFIDVWLHRVPQIVICNQTGVPTNFF